MRGADRVVGVMSSTSRGTDDDLAYARLIAGCARQEKLRALDREAAALVIEQQARDAGDAHKLSVRMQALVDLLREADYWAGRAGREVIGAADVRRALEAQIAAFLRP